MKKNKPTTPPPGLDTIQALLESCKLRHVAAHVPETIERARQQEWTHLEVLQDLFQAEQTRRRNARFERNLKASGLSIQYAIENFDFDLARSRGVKPKLVRELIGSDYIKTNTNLILGAPGRRRS